MKKLCVMLLLTCLLVGCGSQETEVVGKKAVGGAAEKVKAAVEMPKEIEEDITTPNEKPEPSDDTEQEPVDEPMTLDAYRWSQEDMDPVVQEFFKKLKEYRKLYGDRNKVLLNDVTLPTFYEEVTLWDALDEMMLVKYTKEWDIGDVSSDAKLQVETEDDLAKAFGFESSEYASEIFDAVEADYKSSIATHDIVNVYEYCGDYSTVLGNLDLGVGTTTTYQGDMEENMFAVLSFNEDGNSMLEISLVGTLLFTHNGQNYYVLLPNCYSSYAEDGHVDTHDDVELWADWNAIADACVEGPNWLFGMDGVDLKEDHGICMIAEKDLVAMTEEEFLDFAKKLYTYKDTDYAVEAKNIPEASELSEIEKPYDLYYDYLGVAGMAEGADLERLSGNNAYWDTHNIGGLRKEE